ncbi:MAG TPA: PAS domain S-box protein [Thermoanaerobaculia bacterium]
MPKSESLHAVQPFPVVIAARDAAYESLADLIALSCDAAVAILVLSGDEARLKAATGVELSQMAAATQLWSQVLPKERVFRAGSPRDLHLRSHSGTPLQAFASVCEHTADGGKAHVVLLDAAPREWGAVVESMLELSARQAAELVNSRRGPAMHVVQQHETERALKLAHLRLQALLDNMPDLAWIKDEESRFVAVNTALANFMGRTPAEIVGRTDLDLFPPEYGTAYRALDQQVRQSRKAHRLVEAIRSHAGEERWIETVKAPITDESGRIIGTGGIARDITTEQEAARRNAELLRDLERERARLNDIIENVPGVVWEILGNPAKSGAKVAYVSPYVTHLVGADVETVYTGSYERAIHRDDRERVLQELDASYTAGRSCRIEFRMVTPHRGAVWCEAHCSVILDEEGLPCGMRGVLVDVEERKGNEALLRESEERFRYMADNAPVIIWTTSDAGVCQFINRQWTSTTGQTVEEARGLGWLDCLEPSDIERMRATVRNATGRRDAYTVEYRLRDRNGELRETLTNAAPRFDASGRYIGYIGITFDLTDVRRLERQLENEQRLSGLGRLAATIAHEMNNVLMGIQPFAELIRRRGEASMADAATRIIAAVERGKRVTHEILRFARASEPVLRPLSVAEWFADLAPELQSIGGRAVELSISIADDLPPVSADAWQLQQVFVNLVANARDAMTANGTVRVAVRRYTGGGFPAASHHETPAGMLHFSVTDTGCGIAPELLDRIFEPLFSTKRNTGTGLGLTIVHQIVTKHGGRIFVESTPGKGTTFHLLLPTADPNSVAAAAPVSVPVVPAHVNRVLLVEDDVFVAQGICHLLEAQHLRVESVESGAEALALLAGGPPDVAILDVGLPDMNGIELFEIIRRQYPNLPIVFSTGHGDERMLEPQLTTPRTTSLLKPYRLDSLIGAIARVATPVACTEVCS